MPFPATLKLITLSGDFRHGDDGDPRQGVVSITLPTPIRSEGDNVIIPPFDLSVDLVDGTFSIEIPATTDPEWLPNDAQYVVQATFTEDYRKLWWQLPLPWDTAGDAVDLADIGTPNLGTPSLTIRQGVTQPIADGGYKGAWVSGLLYRVGDTVKHGSSVYGALKASTAITPGTDATVWQVYPGGGGGGGAVDSVFGRTGDVVAQSGDYTKTQIGLGNVDNTSDASKPVSTLQAAADSAVGTAAANALAAHASDTTAIHGIADTSVLATQSDLVLKAPLASPALTGTATAVNLTQSGRYLNTPDALTDAATIAVDASLGNDFTVTLGGNRTLGNPTNPSNGQKILFAIRQDGTGNRTLTLDTAYRLGTDIPSVTLSTAANKTDYLGVRYNGTDSTWDVLAFTKGY